jgi:hypothetical protein
MRPIQAFVEVYWLALLITLAGTGLASWAFWRKKSHAIIGLGAAIGLTGIGGLALPFEPAAWIAGVAAALFFLSLLWLVVTGHWSTILGLVLGAGLCIGLGGLGLVETGRGLVHLTRTARSVEFVSPWWLLLLVFVPVVFHLSYRSLAGLGPIRRWVAIGLRCLLVTSLAFALAEMRLRQPSESLTVLFVVDRSLSVPADPDPNDPTAKDRRWQRVQQFIADAVFRRGTGHELDQAGVIAFGRRPRLVLPPSSVDRMVLSDELLIGLDSYYTDIGAAIKLALASFPENTSKRIVLMSDGNENLGNAEEQARLAKLNDVQIDVVPLAAGFRNEQEVLVQVVEAPPQTEQGSRVPIRVLIRSYNPKTVIGTLQLRQKSTEGPPTLIPILAGPGVDKAGDLASVRLRTGLNSFSFRQTLGGETRSYTYEAVFQPLGTVDEDDMFTRGVSGDRPQNNSASTHVVALGRRKVLFVESAKPGGKGQHELLIDRLVNAGKSKFQVAPVTTKELPGNKAELGVFLSNFDSVILANVPAEEFTEDQMEMLRGNTYDQGCGLVMIGGPDSFGAGGWQQTPVEKALPVDCDIKALQVAGKGGLVLIMHASEMAEGNRWQKEIAKLAIQKLSAVDMLGMLYWNFSTAWHIPFQSVGSSRARLLSLVDRMTPNDMPDCNPALELAHKELANPAHRLAKKHIIFISDGDHWNASGNVLSKLRSAGITLTTVCVTSHGSNEVQKMKKMADATGGRSYHVTNPAQLPAIYTQETRIVSQSFIHERPFQPVLHPTGGPESNLPNPLPTLRGFVRTSRKASTLSVMGIEGPQTAEQEFPVLAYWQYGLGKAVAFTSDARTNNRVKGWDQDWAGSEMYLKFWEQVVGWSVRSVETGKLAMTTEYRDGKIRVVIDARDEKQKPLTNLKLEGAVTPPNPMANGGKPIILKFDQKNAGQYEATFKADEAGSYFVNAAAKRTRTENRNGKEFVVEETTDSVRSGVTLPYSPEFADLESNTALLRRLADLTGGTVWDETKIAEISRRGDLYRATPAAFRNLQPIWFWLVALAGIGLFFDVAIRRIAVEPAEAIQSTSKWWDSLRGRREATSDVPEFFERLKTRKAAVGENLVKGTSAKRFDAPDSPVGGPPPGADVEVAAPRPRPVTPPKPDDPVQGDDYFSRLKRGKRKAMEDLDNPDE